MYNPSTSKAECNLHAGLINQDSQNTPQTTNNESYNTFDKSRLRFSTQRFDELQAVYCDPVIEGDVRRLRSIHDLRTYTLASPLLSNVKMHRAFFQVPWSVISPKTWEYLYRQPVKGNDIDYTSVAPNLNLTDFVGYLDMWQQFLRNYKTTVDTPIDGHSSLWFESLVRFCLLVNGFLSKESLPRTLGGRLPIKYDADGMYGRLIDVLSGTIPEDAGVPNLVITSLSFTGPATVDSESSLEYTINPHTNITPASVFNFLREFSLYGAGISSNTPGAALAVDVSQFNGAAYTWTTFADSIQAVCDYIFGTARPFNPSTLVYDKVGNTYNLMPLIAYQCIISQYFTNSQIDDIYSAKMWQQNAKSTYYKIVPGLTQSDRNPLYGFGISNYFSYNGISVEYDAYSGYCMSALLNGELTADFYNMITAESKAQMLCLSYFMELVQVGQSLRYGDYFTTGRAQPLAVGDVTISVNTEAGPNQNTISAIDTNQSLWIQRFLNAVNRAKQSIYDYIWSMAGVSPERREPQPNFICSETYNIAGMEVENTADNQGNIVTLLRNSESRYMYEVICDEPSFIIGIDSFSVAYAYPDAMNHIFKMDDRLEWFNHFMQHVGDRPVDFDELMTPVSTEQYGEAFCYALMYWNFKSAISDAVGGFIDGSLPAWAVLYDLGHWSNAYGTSTPFISPAFLRNHNEDFDKLYSSLTGTTCANRFHFIKSIYFNELANSRQQAYPSLM